jgi:beta-lactamase class A
MRKLAAGLSTCLLLVMSAPSLAGASRWAPGMGSAIRYSQQRAGSISFSVKSPSGRLFAYRGHRVVPAASVFKAMLLAGYLRQASVRDRKLNDDDRSLLAPMIRRSDNSAATTIADRLGSRRIYKLASDAHMRHFHYTRPWGLSSIDATEQARYFFHLERYIPKRHEDYARYLLSHIIRPQRWGVAKVHRPDWDLYFKSGWGSGTGAVSHQVAFLEKGDQRIALAIMITDSPSHAYSIETLRGIAKRLLNDLPRSWAPDPGNRS